MINACLMSFHVALHGSPPTAKLVGPTMALGHTATGWRYVSGFSSAQLGRFGLVKRLGGETCLLCGTRTMCEEDA